METSPLPAPEEIGRIVRGLREARGMKMKDLAERASVSLFTLRRVEHGHRAVRGSTLGLIAMGLGVPLPQLLGESERDTERDAS
jgi:transcriptional regulator with XRE-family HTH domain